MHFAIIAILVAAATTLVAAQPASHIPRDVSGNRAAYEIAAPGVEPVLDALETAGDEDYPASRPITIRDTSSGNEGNENGHDVDNTALGADGTITNEGGSSDGGDGGLSHH